MITIIEGDAHETIKQHKEPIDVVFFDAEKKGYVDYLAQLLPQIRPGGLILGHDMRRRCPTRSTSRRSRRTRNSTRRS